MTTIPNNIKVIKNENNITIQNIDNYRLKIIDGNLILERIIPFIDEETLLNKDLSYLIIRFYLQTSCQFLCYRQY